MGPRLCSRDYSVKSSSVLVRSNHVKQVSALKVCRSEVNLDILPAQYLFEQLGIIVLQGEAYWRFTWVTSTIDPYAKLMQHSHHSVVLLSNSRHERADLASSGVRPSRQEHPRYFFILFRALTLCNQHNWCLAEVICLVEHCRWLVFDVLKGSFEHLLISDGLKDRCWTFLGAPQAHLRIKIKLSAIF